LPRQRQNLAILKPLMVFLSAFADNYLPTAHN